MEQSELQELQQASQYGQQLRRLRTNPDFKDIIEKLFLDDGADILWENVRHLTEVQLTNRGSERNVEILEALKGQIKSRLDFKGFMDTIENDAEGADLELDDYIEAVEETA